MHYADRSSTIIFCTPPDRGENASSLTPIKMPAAFLPTVPVSGRARLDHAPTDLAGRQAAHEV